MVKTADPEALRIKVHNPIAVGMGQTAIYILFDHLNVENVAHQEYVDQNIIQIVKQPDMCNASWDESCKNIDHSGLANAPQFFAWNCPYTSKAYMDLRAHCYELWCHDLDTCHSEFDAARVIGVCLPLPRSGALDQRPPLLIYVATRQFYAQGARTPSERACT